ncbi:MAG: OmpA family protein [Candidatus Hydrogenedentes bacterium]|nr:OmpA family protein [Candidatus Hydrogenedentota bacterium]
MSNRRQKHEEHENEERWLLTYADLITLLMVFFVVMYALSNVDKQKFQALARAMSAEFGTPVANPTGIGGKVVPGPSVTPPPRAGTERTRTRGNPKTEQIDALRARMKKLKGDLDAMVKASGLQEQISVKMDPSGHKVSMGLSDSLLFGAGSADLTQAAQELVEKIGNVLATSNYVVNVEGHTDNVPINNARYSSNLQLSTERAVNVVSYMIKTAGIPGNRLSASGYAEHHPVASNDTEEGRAKNRRVEFVIHDPNEDEIVASSMETEEEPVTNGSNGDAVETRGGVVERPGGAIESPKESEPPAAEATTDLLPEVGSQRGSGSRFR